MAPSHVEDEVHVGSDPQVTLPGQVLDVPAQVGSLLQVKVPGQVAEPLHVTWPEQVVPEAQVVVPKHVPIPGQVGAE